MPVLGECLQLHSVEPDRHWFRSQRMRLRLSVRGADELVQVIERRLHPGGGGGVGGS
jgi:hypothetical protein